MPIIHNPVVPVPKKQVEEVVTQIEMTLLTFAQLAQSLIDEYNKCGPVCFDMRFLILTPGANVIKFRVTALLLINATLIGRRLSRD